MSHDGKRTSAALRELLFEMIDGVRAGTVDDKTARTVATLSASILKSVEVEIQFKAQLLAGKINAAEIGDMELASLPPPIELQPQKVNAQGHQLKPRFVPGSSQTGSR